MNFDASSLYPAAMWDENSVFLKMEIGFASKQHMNNIYVEAFNNQTFSRDGKKNALLQTKYYNPLDLIFQHLPIKKTVKNFEVNRMRIRYIVDVLTSVDFQENVKLGGKLTEFSEGVIYCGNFEVFPFRKIIEKLFALRQKYKDERNDLMQGLVRLIMNSLYGPQTRKNVNKFCKSEH